MSEPVDASRLLDERGLSSFNIKLAAVCFFIVLLDGYDITAMAFAVPMLAKQWAITDASAFGPVLGASLIGMLIGAPTLGFVGDRFGRKIAIVISCLIFGGFTWITVEATTLNMLFAFRLLAGVGIGGLLPNVIALTGEFAPRQYRATMIIVMFSGAAFGGAIPGVVSNLLVPTFGWQALFHVGGATPVVVALLCYFLLPESLKFLVLKGDRQEAVLKLLAVLRPDRQFAPDTAFFIGDERKQRSSFSPKYLFADGLAVITPLLWLLYVVSLMAYFFLLSWTPYLLTSANVPMQKAALATMLFQFGGAVGGWVLARPIDKMGLAPIAVLFVIAVPVTAMIGYVGSMSEPLLMLIEFIAGFCVLGIQLGLNATAAMIYPTSIRANGSGWALGIGRVGSIVGPILGGALIQMKLSVTVLYMLAAIPLAIGAVACIILSRLYVKHFQGAGRGQRDELDRLAAEKR